MSQDYPDILETRKQNLSRAEFLARDDANRSNFAGSSAPIDPVVGQHWYNDVSGWTFQWNGSRWRLVADRFETDVWPEDYGAVGDGSTSDKIALGNFFAAVNAGKTGRLRRGATYNAVDGYWVLNSSARIIGEGRESAFKRTADVLHPLIDVTASNAFMRDFRVFSTFAGSPTPSALNCPIRLTACADAQIENIWTDGRFYVGVQFDGVAGVLANNITAKGHLNRLLYVYQACTDVRLNNLFLDGAESGSTPYSYYGLNVNGAYVVGNRLTASNVVAKNLRYHGVGVAAQFNAWALSNVEVSNVTDAAGVGLLIQEANGYSNQRGVVHGLMVDNCAFGLEMRQVYYVDVIGAQAIACGRGFYLQDTQYCSLQAARSYAATLHGFDIAATAPSLSGRNLLSGCDSIGSGGWGYNSNADCYNIRDSACHGYNNVSGNFNLLGTSNESYARSVA